MYANIAPIFPTINILTTNLFYKDKLNFETAYSGNYLVVSKGLIELYFYEHRNKLSFYPASCFIFISNIEDLYAEFCSIDMIKPEGKLFEKPGSMMEFSITDNNGHTLRFGKKLRRN